MATRTQYPASTDSKSPHTGSSTRYPASAQVRQRPHTRDGPGVSHSVRTAPSIAPPHREGRYALRQTCMPSLDSAHPKTRPSRSARSRGVGLGLGVDDLQQTDASYFRPRPSCDAKLRGVAGYVNVERTISPELGSSTSRVDTQSPVGGFPASSSTNAVASFAAPSTNVLPASNSMPLLTTALQRLKDSDLETFKLERACGMTPDPARMARLVGAFSADEEVANVLLGTSGSRGRGMGEGMEGNEISTSSLNLRVPASQRTPVAEMYDIVQDSPRVQTSIANATLAPPFADASAKVSRHKTLPSSTSAPASLKKYLSPDGTCRAPTARSSLGTSRTEAPPFAQMQNPHAQLKCLEQLIDFNGGKWGLTPGRSGHDAGGRYELVQSLIDVEKLLLEHTVDANLEYLRTQIERRADGVGYMERLATTKGKEKATEQVDSRWRRPLLMVDVNEHHYRVFGQPLHLTQMYGFCVASMAGYQHDLPIVVYACVEELYRTGMTVPGLFRTPPDRMRHIQLIESFDRGSGFGKSVTLAKESTADICALLLSFIERMPRALWHESLYTALWKLCVRPSLQREKEMIEEVERVEAGGMHGEAAEPRRHSTTTTTIAIFDGSFGHAPNSSAGLTPYRTRSSSLGSASQYSSLGSSLDAAAVMNIHSKHNPAVLATAQRTLAAESAQIDAARALFRLLPRAQLSLIAYLLAFFTQIPFSPQNQLTYEDIARIFAVPIFLGKQSSVQKGSANISPTIEMNEKWQRKKEEARTMMLWVLRRWGYISPGLFVVDENADEIKSVAMDEDEKVDATSFGSDTPGSMRSRAGSSIYSQPENSSSTVNTSDGTGSMNHSDLPHGSPYAKCNISSLEPIRSLQQSAFLSSSIHGQGHGSSSSGPLSQDIVMEYDVPVRKSGLEREVHELRQELEMVKKRLDQVPVGATGPDVTMLPV